MEDQIKKLKLAKLQALEKEEKMREELPHLYGFPWYDWAWDFFTTRNKMALLTAANQVSKSSTNIRTIIEWAGNTELWPELWKTKPIQLWYLYPDYNFATSEVETKWIPEFLPRGSMKDHPTYGWKIEYGSLKKVKYIQFNSGVRVYFKAYTQDVHSLQGSTVHAIFCDEELPSDLYSELQFRLAASDGYFRMVFTATRGQEFWREAMEEIDGPMERFKGAWKRSIKLRDCLYYKDGSNSPWTEERIQAIEASCKDENERLRRVDGRFIRSDNRRYWFDKSKNFLKPEEDKWWDKPPDNWIITVGVDVGSGAIGNSKSAIVFVAFLPDFSRGRVFRAWRGDDQITTAGDVFNKFLELRQGLDIMAQYYDHAAVDFGNIAERNGEPFLRADKSAEKGEEIVSTAFKYGLISVDDTGDIELTKLANELTNVGKDTIKGDDLCDALRYALSKTPLAWTLINKKKQDEEKEKALREFAPTPEQGVRTSGYVTKQKQMEQQSINADMEFWREQYE